MKDDNHLKCYWLILAIIVTFCMYDVDAFQGHGQGPLKGQGQPQGQPQAQAQAMQQQLQFDVIAEPMISDRDTTDPTDSLTSHMQQVERRIPATARTGTQPPTITPIIKASSIQISKSFSLGEKDSINEHQLSQTFPARLCPLSFDPLLCYTEEPLLTPRECQVLIDWCQQTADENGNLSQKVGNTNSFTNYESDNDENEGGRLLKKLQRYVHHSILGLDNEQQIMKHHHIKDNDMIDNFYQSTDYVIPRYLHYNAAKATGPPMQSLLPDGLHVDTNNHQHFRHWTVLVYLDDLPTGTYGGATNFPLAKPLRRSPSEAFDSRDSDSNQDTKCEEIAEELLWNLDLHHTQLGDDSEKSSRVSYLRQSLEQKALDLYHRDQQTTPSFSNVDDSTTGIRVLPRLGHACVFSSQRHDGFPNPNGFHAGEALLVDDTKESSSQMIDGMIFRKSKNVLSFFFEVPWGSFTDRSTFGNQIKKREQDFLKFHQLVGDNMA